MKKGYLLSIAGLFLLVFSLNLLSAGTCRDDHGRYYFCEKQYYDYENYRYNYDYYSKIYYVTPSYQYKDNYGNTITVQRDIRIYESNYNTVENSYQGQDYYNYYHYNSKDSRYGLLLREQGYSYNTVNVKTQTKPLIVYIK